MQAGHFISRVHLATCFHRANVHPQCPRCNLFLNGNMIEYTLWMQKVFGQKIVDDLRMISRSSVKFTRSDYEEMIESFKRKLETLNV